MIKRTLYFGNAAYLSLKLEQLQISIPLSSEVRTFPIEDIGLIVLDCPQITLTQALIEKLLTSGCVLISCDSRHLPLGLMLPLVGHTLQSERMRSQQEASIPLKKQLWQQTIACKISNQAKLLSLTNSLNAKNMIAWSKNVKSGDLDNLEARAAVYYWSNLFPKLPQFRRGREEAPPNNLLDYGYGVLRAIVARSLVASGINPTLGIFHHNKYNPYCLADDIMEPYRPYVDKIVCDIINQNIPFDELDRSLKAQLLSVATEDVMINKQKSPLMVAVSKTTASLAKCYLGESRKILYPEM